MRRQQLAAEHERTLAWADAEVAAGRLSQTEADTYVEAHMHNVVTPAPQASDRITARFTEFVVAGLNAGGAGKGWYKQGDGTARYWDGEMWTHHTTSVRVASELVHRLSTEDYKGVRREVQDPTSVEAVREPATRCGCRWERFVEDGAPYRLAVCHDQSPTKARGDSW